MIILDEPTSGLDSAAAAAITKLLGNIAKRTASTIVCTIHQPSAAVLAVACPPDSATLLLAHPPTCSSSAAPSAA